MCVYVIYITLVARLLTEKGYDVQFVECDVSSEEAVDNLIDVAADAGNGTIDALVNVAGVDIIVRHVTLT